MTTEEPALSKRRLEARVLNLDMLLRLFAFLCLPPSRPLPNGFLSWSYFVPEEKVCMQERQTQNSSLIHNAMKS